MRLRRIIWGVVLLLGLNGARAADWPMWGGNAQHTFMTPETMPETLHLHWSLSGHRPAPAWPASQTKLQFDAAPYPIEANDLLYLTSTVTDSLTAIELETGETRWRRSVNGPVRFAPVVAGDKIYFGSDDGYLYCLQAGTGAVVWRFRGGPDDRQILGNDRLISMWPVRGAPVVADGIVYFAAGIWPFMGIFIHAVDAASGEKVWTNSGTGSMYIMQQHSSPAFAGIAPQGYLSVAGDKLLVAGGRTVPAAFDRLTGAFLYLDMQSRQFGKDQGGYGVRVADGRFFNGNAMYQLEDGKGLLALPADVVDGTTFYHAANGELVTADDAAAVTQEKDRRGNVLEKTQPTIVRQKLALVVDRVLLKAGKHLVALAPGNTLFIFDTTRSAIVWQETFPEAPREAVVAAGRLLVATEAGTVFCFGAEARQAQALTTVAAPPRSVEAKSEIVDTILKQVRRTKNAYALLLQPDSDQLVADLLAATDFQLIVVEDSAYMAAGYHRQYDNSAVKGRVHILEKSPSELQLPAYFADLIVAGERFHAQKSPALEPARIINSIRPHGGVALFSKQSVAWLKTSFAPQPVDDMLSVTRAGALPGAANWTHHHADAANSLVSKDSRVKAPLGLLWFGGPSNDEILPRHGHGPSPEVVDGRLFIEGADMLRAVDVYNGKLLWQTAIPGIGKFYDNTSHQPGAGEIGGNYVSAPDAVYAFTPKRCLKLDVENGRVLGRFVLPDGAKWGSLALAGDTLIAAGSPLLVPYQDRSTPPPDAEPLIERNATWTYLAGTDPAEDWTRAGALPAGWKDGKAGFGYGDDDDLTDLADMKGNYTRVYVRREFQADLSKLKGLNLEIRYDDAFIAYLNGQEVLRKGVGIGSGASAGQVAQHEAGTAFDAFPIPVEALSQGTNVFCIEGHNTELNSSDFTLDPALSAVPSEAPKVSLAATPDTTKNADYSSASKVLFALARHSGEVIWKRDAQFSFRHNAIAVSSRETTRDGRIESVPDKVFCIDSLSDAKRSFLQRRGVQLTDKPVLYALDAATGEVVWQSDAHVFGTWLSYSAEHDVLFQGGSANHDRAADESRGEMAVFQAGTGELLWTKRFDYGGPCMLWHDWIITQGRAFKLLSGEQIMHPNPLTNADMEWKFTRNYGCNTAICSENLITFRSAAAGFYDLNSYGTGNLGGFKSSCTANLIAAGGVLNAPEYTRTCECSYQNQTSLALVHMPDVEVWTFNRFDTANVSDAIQRIGVNFGAPGDHFDNLLWLEWPIVGGPSPALPITVEPDAVKRFVQHTSALAASGSDADLRFVAASGITGARKITLALGREGRYRVRLIFSRQAPGADMQPFDVTLNQQRVLENFRPSGSDVIVKEFDCSTDAGRLVLEFSQPAAICGLEATIQQDLGT